MNQLFLVPFKAEAKLLTSIFPNCKSITDSRFPNHWTFKGGEIISWNIAGKAGMQDTIEKVGIYDNFSSVILFGSCGSLSPNLKLGQIFSCKTIKDTNHSIFELPIPEDFENKDLLCTDDLILDNEERKKLWEEYNCHIVDMEGSVFANFADKGYFGKANPYIIRFVSDTYDCSAPIDSDSLKFTGKFQPEIQQEIIKHRKILLKI